MSSDMQTSRYRIHGFALIVAMTLLLALTLLVIGGVRGTTMNERISGNQMDRTLAYQAAEQGITQAMAALTSDANADLCIAGCTNIAGSGIKDSVTALPDAWTASDTSVAQAVVAANGQKSTGSYVVNMLPDSMLPAGKSLCKPYSIRSRGLGMDTRTVVVLQTVAVLCPV